MKNVLWAGWRPRWEVKIDGVLVSIRLLCLQEQAGTNLRDDSSEGLSVPSYLVHVYVSQA